MAFEKDWDDLEKTPDYSDNYFDVFVKEDNIIQAAANLVDYLTVENENALLVEMLKMRTGDLTDGRAGGRKYITIFRRRKAELRKLAKSGELIVIRPVTEPVPLSRAVFANRIGDFYDGKDTWFAVMKKGFQSSLLEEIKNGNLDVEQFYKDDEKKTTKDDEKKTTGLMGLIRKVFKLRVLSR